MKKGRQKRRIGGEEKRRKGRKKEKFVSITDGTSSGTHPNILIH